MSVVPASISHLLCQPTAIHCSLYSIVYSNISTGGGIYLIVPLSISLTLVLVLTASLVVIIIVGVAYGNGPAQPVEPQPSKHCIHSPAAVQMNC